MSRKLATQWGLAIVLLATTAIALAHPPKVVVIPLGGDEASTYKTAFYTETQIDGNIKGKCIGGVDGPSCADKICQEEADSPGSMVQGKKFKAWISRVLTDDFANHESSFNTHDLPYRTTDGKLIASNFADLLDGQLENPIWFTAKGVRPTGFYAKTGIYRGGSFSGVYTCDNWTSASSTKYSIVGINQRAQSDWTEWTFTSGNSRCHIPAGLYCFEQ